MNSFNNYNQQNLNERIDSQIAQLNQMKEQIKNNQQPAINQTFQLAPTNNHSMKFANSINDVNKEIVYNDTPFFSKDLSILWIKNAKGDVKSYELKEIVEKNEKDLLIDALMLQIEDLKGRLNNETYPRDDNAEQIATNTATNDESIGTTTKKSKSSSVSKISGSKKE
jgi:hypothetical protein